MNLPAWLDTEVALRLVLSVLYGGALGLEREAHGRAAGLRTLILVCTGATLITVASSLMPPLSSGSDRDIVRVDPGRIAAGIVTGVGFLGGAVVIKLGDLVRGVTTAASIWFVAAIGIVLGQGHYALATYSTVLGLAVLGLFPYLERFIRPAVYRRIAIETTGERMAVVRGGVHEALEELDMRVLDLFALRGPDGLAELTFHVRAEQRLQAADVVARLSAIEGVGSVRWH